MSEQIKRWGSISVLSGLGGTLVALLFTWVFATTFSNTVILTPLVASIDKLTASNILMIDRFQNMNSRMDKNEVKLFNVIDDCDENHQDIKNCKLFYKKD